MPEAIALFVFVAVLLMIEYVYVWKHQMTISEHVQAFFHRLDVQMAVAIGVVIGWFIAHFTQGGPR